MPLGKIVASGWAGNTRSPGLPTAVKLHSGMGQRDRRRRQGGWKRWGCPAWDRREVPRVAGWRSGLALAVGGILPSVGCQVEYAGMTLPSGKYMHDDVQYFPSGRTSPGPTPRRRHSGLGCGRWASSRRRRRRHGSTGWSRRDLAVFNRSSAAPIHQPGPDGRSTAHRCAARTQSSAGRRPGAEPPPTPPAPGAPAGGAVPPPPPGGRPMPAGRRDVTEARPDVACI